MPRPLRRHPSREDLSSAANSARHHVPRNRTTQQQQHAATNFQTPPSRYTASNPRHQSPHITPDALPIAMPAHPAVRANAFTVFGPVAGVMGDQDAVDDDFERHTHTAGDIDDDDDVFATDDAAEGVEDSEEIEGQDEEAEEDEEEIVGQLDGAEDEEMRDREKSPLPLPANLREISSLASWTVSTSKPGCGVSALRHPSPTQYWQSDGPQPHTLTLHFFKLVAVVRIRVYLDFELDESYTPTKMVFLAGMGGNDLVEFAIWEGDGPCGWVDVSLEGVGGRNGGWVSGGDGVRGGRRRSRYNGRRVTGTERRRRHENGGRGDEVEIDDQDEVDDDDDQNNDEPDDPYAGNVLKAMVIQMRVMENHQNGKDTHVRGFQVFACDDSRRRIGAAPSASADGRHCRQSVRQSLRGGAQDVLGVEHVHVKGLAFTSGLAEPDWMGEPVIR